MRRALAGFVLCVAALLASSLVPLPAAVQAQGDSPPTGVREVQIRARRLASGNVEFGLQVTNPADGQVSYPTLANRFFLYDSPDIEVGEWYYSEVVKVGEGAGSTLVEIGARRLASGNVEFGLRLGRARILAPSVRFFVYGSASPGGPWQYSSVINTYSEGSLCASGTPVLDPEDNPGLVKDCTALLSAMRHLGQTPGLNWSGNRRMNRWDGVRVSSVREGSTTARRVTYLSVRGWNSEIPADFAELGALEELHLRSSAPSGEIPSELGRLTNLKELTIDGTRRSRLTGSIPSSLCNLRNLVKLNLEDNDLNGQIPSCLGSLSNLEELDLHNNDLSGQIPPTLGNLSELEKLELNDNDLSGSIPASLGYLTKITDFYLQNNELSGTIPSSLLSYLTNLDWLDLSNNKLSSWSPSSLSGLRRTDTSSTILDISDNDLSGQIPATLGTLSNTRGNVYIQLRDNKFSGTIPPELANITKLFSLDLSDNDLTGAIPSALVSHANLSRLNLSDNALSGAVPHGWARKTGSPRDYFLSLDLSDNSFSGTIPAQLSQVGNITSLELDNNELNGTIPFELGSITSLYTLGLSGNSLSGSVPSQLGGLTNLWNLYLQGNTGLTGCIPASLSNAYVRVTAQPDDRRGGQVVRFHFLGSQAAPVVTGSQGALADS